MMDGHDTGELFSQSANVLSHDAEYTGEEYRHWRGGGLQALGLALKAGVGQLGLSRDRSDRKVDDIVRQGLRFFPSRNSSTTCYGVSCDFEISL